MLYDSVKEEMMNAMIDLAKRVECIKDDKTFIAFLASQWLIEARTIKSISDILIPLAVWLTKKFVEKHTHLTTIQDNSENNIQKTLYSIFKSHVYMSTHIRLRLRQALLDSVLCDRIGEDIDRVAVRGTVFMLVAISSQDKDIYRTEFEEPILNATRSFYTERARMWLDQTTCPEYIRKVEDAVNNERSRGMLLYEPSTTDIVISIMFDHLVCVNLSFLMEMSTGPSSMLDAGMWDDLHRMYLVLKSVTGGREALRSVFVIWLKRVGTAIMQHPTRAKDPEGRCPSGRDPLMLISDVMILKDRVDEILNNVFVSEQKQIDMIFMHGANDAFSSFFNVNGLAAEALALFMHSKLCNGASIQIDEVIEQLLEKCVILFRFVNSKDEFERYYKQLLAKRLLLKNSTSFDLEQSMIAKLKSECGFQFTTQMECMFRDISISGEMARTFDNFCSQTAIALPFEFSVTVLTSGNWPMAPSPPCVFHEDFMRCMSTFETFYFSQYSGRRLAWLTSVGHVGLKATFCGQHHDVNVTTHQAAILLLFNNHNTFSFKEIKQATNIQDVELRRCLLSLYAGKFRVICKNPAGKDIADEDLFSFNEQFSSRMLRFKIPMISMKENVAERSVTLERIEEDRKSIVDTTIVRIMKARLEMDHVLLISEVTKLLAIRFPVTPQTVKKRIESLIEHEYIERDTNDIKRYRYVA